MGAHALFALRFRRLWTAFYPLSYLELCREELFMSRYRPSYLSGTHLQTYFCMAIVVGDESQTVAFRFPYRMTRIFLLINVMTKSTFRAIFSTTKYNMVMIYSPFRRSTVIWLIFCVPSYAEESHITDISDIRDNQTGGRCPLYVTIFLAFVSW